MKLATFLAVAIVGLVVAAWSTLWVMSSAGVACTACNCEYSLFHEIPRCRQPVYAVIAVVVGLALTAFGLWRIVRGIRPSKPPEANDSAT